MRHAFGSNLVDAGGTIDEVQELLGHVSLSSTEVYLHPDPGRLRTAVDRVPSPREIAETLQEQLDSHDHELVFCGARGAYLRRSSMSRRVWRAALDGGQHTGTGPIIVGMHFHDLRHTHKTWLIEDDIPEIAQAKRLGHRMPGVRGIYSHVTPAMQQRITGALQDRWRASQPRPAGEHRHLHAA